MISIFEEGVPGSVYAGEAKEFRDIRSALASRLRQQTPLNRGTWQQLSVADSPMHATYELEQVTLWIGEVPLEVGELQEFIDPDLPWAEDHFQERVGGKPINPGKAHEYWPYHGADAALHLRQQGDDTIYDHNYMERFWPKEAGWDNNDAVIPHMGIRFWYGDLSDVVDLIVAEPMTRQAYLPVWFPEDTGAVSRQRVPCTLGYHFMVREGVLSAQYFMRSTEIYRHFTNDVYMAMRLMQWVMNQVNHRSDGHPILGLGQLAIHTSSLHGFVGDLEKIEELI